MANDLLVFVAELILSWKNVVFAAVKLEATDDRRVWCLLR